MSERDPFTLEPIPEFAMQPARESDDSDGRDVGEFDPTVYEQLLAGLEVWEPATTTSPAATASPVIEESMDGEGEPASEPIPAPAPAPAPTPAAAADPTADVEKAAAGTVIPADDLVILDRLGLVDMVPCDAVRIRVEEDILVPDVKPDLASILTMDGTLQFTENQRNIRGELTLQTLYVPQGKGVDRAVVAIESRIPFQQSGWTGRLGGSQENSVGRTENQQEYAAGSLGMKASAKIESLEYSVVNERKFRVKAMVLVEGRNYRKRELELFQGLKGDEVQMLQEKLVVTDVVRRKTEVLELEEDLMLPDGMPEVGKILRCDVNLVENHKQISREKAVISGSAYYNIMYLPLENSSAAGQPGSAGVIAGGDGQDGEPVLFQAKGEFTQFLTLGRSSDGPQSGRAFFQLTKSAAEPKGSESGVRNLIHVKTEGETFLELYRDVERQVVTDAYHHQKEMVFETEEVTLMQICPGGISETAVREVVSVPEGVESMKRVSFLSGDLRNVESRIEGGRNVTEGVVLAKLVCLAEPFSAATGSAEDVRPPASPFQIQREIPFRVASEIPSGMDGVIPDNEVKLRELRFDRLNDRQIELNASVTVNGAVVCRKNCPMIRNVGFLESGAADQETPGMILYISRGGDSLWKIARKYRTTIETLEKINGIDGSAVLAPGTKLLIVK